MLFLPHVRVHANTVDIPLFALCQPTQLLKLYENIKHSADCSITNQINSSCWSHLLFKHKKYKMLSVHSLYNVYMFQCFIPCISLLRYCIAKVIHPSQCSIWFIHMYIQYLHIILRIYCSFN